MVFDRHREAVRRRSRGRARGPGDRARRRRGRYRPESLGPRRHAAVDSDHRAVDVGSLGVGQCDDHMRHLLRTTVATKGDRASGEMVTICFRDHFSHAREGRARTHAVRRHPAAAGLHRQRASEAEQGVFGNRVRPSQSAGGEGLGRGHVPIRPASERRRSARHARTVCIAPVTFTARARCHDST